MIIQIFKKFAVVTLAFVGLSYSLWASTLMKVEDQEVVNESAWMGLVEVSGFENLNSDRAATLVKGRVLDVIKGPESKQGDPIVFEIPGGQVGTRQSYVLGFSKKDFKPGESYFVFLSSAPVSERVARRGAAPQLVKWKSYLVKDRNGRKEVSEVGSLTSARHSGNGMALTHSRAKKSYNEFVADLYRKMSSPN